MHDISRRPMSKLSPSLTLRRGYRLRVPCSGISDFPIVKE